MNINFSTRYILVCLCLVWQYYTVIVFCYSLCVILKKRLKAENDVRVLFQFRLHEADYFRRRQLGVEGLMKDTCTLYRYTF